MQDWLVWINGWATGLAQHRRFLRWVDGRTRIKLLGRHCALLFGKELQEAIARQASSARAVGRKGRSRLGIWPALAKRALREGSSAESFTGW